MPESESRQGRAGAYIQPPGAVVVAVEMARGPRIRTAALIATLATVTGTDAAEPAGSGLAHRSLAECERADEVSDTEKPRVLDLGRQLAEAALAADPGDPKAHFAVFCNLGKQTQLVGLGVGSLRTLQRLQRELDTTLALAPDDTDALAAKGAMLLSLPPVLGGDNDEAQRLLRRVLEIDPQHPAARRYLTRLTAQGGARDEVASSHASH